MGRSAHNPGKGAFGRCVQKVAARGGSYDPRAVCAAAGRKKYGAKRFARMAAAGRGALNNPGQLEFDTATAANQYKRLIEAEGSKGVSISRRGRKHVVKWNPLGAVEFLTYAQPVLQRAGKKLKLNRKRKPAAKKNGLFDWGRKTTVYKVKAGTREASTGRHKGYTIYKRADGSFTVPSLDSSAFDSKRDATRFIDSWVKNNPKKRRNAGAGSKRHTKKKYKKAGVPIRFRDYPVGSSGRVRQLPVLNPGRYAKAYLSAYRAAERADDAYQKALDRSGEDRYGVHRKASVVSAFRRKVSADTAMKRALDAMRSHGETVNNPARTNPVEAAQEKYEEFHGRPSEDLVEVDTEVHVHDVLSGIGELVKLVILSTNGRYRVTLTKFKGTLVAQNEDSDKMPQLYFEGGDQEVSLEDFGISDPVHEIEELGRMEWIYYHTVKDHLGDDGGDAIYKHKLRRIRGGKKGREKPVVIYDVRNRLLSIAGGAYTILPEGIDN